MARAFDDVRPPDMDLIDDCVHCGFCLPTCPTYSLWSEEMDSPRGRIVLMRAALEEGSAMSDALVQHFDRCLGCMACVTSCPSGVRYDRLIETTRPQVERNHRRPLKERALRAAVFATVTRPRTLRVLARVASLARRSGLASLATRPAVARRAPVMASLTSLAPARRRPGTAARATPPSGVPRGRVGLLRGCVQRAFFGDVNSATTRVLAAEGFEVVAPEAPACCGALMLHTGEEPRARALAKTAIEAFEGCDLIVTNAAGCGSAMKTYGELLADDPTWSERASATSGRVRDIAELLGGIEPRAARHPLHLRVAYHDACHLAHAQGIRAEPRALLEAIPGIELLEPDDWEICCGSAGIYNLLQPEAARALGERKAANLLATRPDAIAAGNPGCILQLDAHLRAAGDPVPLYHPVELLDASISNEGI